MGQIVKPLYVPRYVPTGEEVAVIETDKGVIRAELFGKDAPVTVGNFIELAQKGFYDNLNFYGRKDNDVVVGGCPITRPLRPQQVRMAVREQLRGIHPGMGDAGYVIADEWAGNPRNHHVEGSLSLTHKKSPNSGSCQFFFSLVDHPEYDDMFTVYGQVVEGLDVMHRLRIGDLIERIHIEGAHEIPAADAAGEVEDDNAAAVQAVEKLLSRKPVV